MRLAVAFSRHAGERHVVVQAAQPRVVLRQVLVVDDLGALEEFQRLFVAAERVGCRAAVDVARRPGHGVLVAQLRHQPQRFADAGEALVLFPAFAVKADLLATHREFAALVVSEPRLAQPELQVAFRRSVVLAGQIFVQFFHHPAHIDGVDVFFISGLFHTQRAPGFFVIVRADRFAVAFFFHRKLLCCLNYASIST